MGTPRGAGVLTRAAGMLFVPGRTWDRIATEPADASGLLLRYAAPLAAIQAVCSVAGPLKFGFNIANVALWMSPLGLILSAVAGYAATFAALWLAGWALSLVSGWFGGERDRARALELVTYAATATWIAGLAELSPGLGLSVGILAWVYSLYAVYLGLTPMLAVPAPRRLYAFVLILLLLVALWSLRGMLMAWASTLGGPLTAYAAPR